MGVSLGRILLRVSLELEHQLKNKRIKFHLNLQKVRSLSIYQNWGNHHKKKNTESNKNIEVKFNQNLKDNYYKIINKSFEKLLNKIKLFR